MTTEIEIIASHIPGLAESAFNYMSKLADRLNFFKPGSDLYQLNHSPRNSWQSLTPLLWEILNISQQMTLKTGGVFRADFEGVSLKPEGSHGYELGDANTLKLGTDTLLNLSGIAKGFIVDKVFDYLDQGGAQNILVNAGGDLRARSVEAEHPWKIGLVNPLDTGQCYGHISLMSGALTTSGVYERNLTINNHSRSHFFDTQKAEYLASPPYLAVTVQGESAAIAEVYAKCLLMGTMTRPCRDYKALGVARDTHRVVIFQ